MAWSLHAKNKTLQKGNETGHGGLLKRRYLTFNFIQLAATYMLHPPPVSQWTRHPMTASQSLLVARRDLRAAPGPRRAALKRARDLWREGTLANTRSLQRQAGFLAGPHAYEAGILGTALPSPVAAPRASPRRLHAYMAPLDTIRGRGEVAPSLGRQSGPPSPLRARGDDGRREGVVWLDEGSQNRNRGGERGASCRSRFHVAHASHASPPFLPVVAHGPPPHPTGAMCGWVGSRAVARWNERRLTRRRHRLASPSKGTRRMPQGAEQAHHLHLLLLR